VDGLQPALDMFLTALDSLLAVEPFEDSDLVGEDSGLVGADSPLAGKGNLEVEVDGHLVQDNYQAVAGSPLVEESKLQAVVGILQAVVGILQAVVGILQAEKGILQAVEGNLQIEKGNPQEEQNLQGLGRACVQSRPFPHSSSLSYQLS